MKLNLSQSLHFHCFSPIQPLHSLAVINPVATLHPKIKSIATKNCSDKSPTSHGTTTNDSQKNNHVFIKSETIADPPLKSQRKGNNMINPKEISWQNSKNEHAWCSKKKKSTCRAMFWSFCLACTRPPKMLDRTAGVVRSHLVVIW